MLSAKRISIAIDNSDAIVFSSANLPAELKEYALSTGKTILEYEEDQEEFNNKYAEFFNNLSETE